MKSQTYPKNWDIEPLKNSINLINGRAYALHEWESSGIPVIRLQNLTGSSENYYYSNLNLPEKNYCYSGDLLYMWSATFGPYIWSGEKAIFHYHIWKLGISSRNDKDYIYHLLNNISENLKKTASNGGTMLHITKGFMDELLLPLPPFDEQQKIAQALTDADNYISALEKLIEKKKMIKEGLMANLLTGKQRLKEFAFNEDGTAKGYKDSELGKIPEDWDLKYFTDVFSFLSTASFSRDQLTTEENTSACIHYGDIHTKLDYFIDTNSFISGYVSASQVMNYVAIQQGDLIIADASEDLEGIGKSVEVLNQPNIKVVSGLHTFLARDSKENFALGFRSFISSNPLILKQYKRLASGLKVYSLSKSTFKNILLPIPPKGEQESISKILFNHIQEITILNKKLEKAKAIKIGMMQKLLTGEIRLA
ncbi:TPA: restriction endonuclease subunit S [Acinetobacter nosocomialis]|uniref:Type I restriction modification DNA specificity domain-containing protein n=2 Tax=Acinetobacter calcoaceticus/baumannii complex TaxID=909768 RepID=A0AB36M4Q7_ACINO|nr:MULTISPECIES: restriction endonuclease subunit S [Acinetobacter calcoaceticus/baumannii complex]EXB70227.1 type I restriction modification DNA specificity domain protein [Acinetobacter sp. 21871]EXR64467.1 type I restriction modification DNA specificity domain protein [Acinetobacter sp. 1424608]MBJ8460943.1 restriction endonuclease subunit S [Acinetobacter nosocomialis]OTL99763.1 hypothetical protein B9X58_04395 [Acinetobacter nosocomialis]HDG9822770.1 restriction endonuclease subunit S [Ac